MPDGTEKHQLVSLNSKTGTQDLPEAPLDTAFKAAHVGEQLIRSNKITKPAVYVLPETFVYSIKKDNGLFISLKERLLDGVLHPHTNGDYRKNSDTATFDALFALEHYMPKESSRFISGYYIPD
jgi:hypothetical protein